MDDTPDQKSQILIVDDNTSFLDLFLSLPEAREYHVTPVTTARQAFDVLAQSVVDLVITDIAMPEMSGLEFFKRLRQLQPEMPVILITAYGCTQEAINAIQLGAFHYFEKPINTQLDLFWSTVRQAIARNQLQWQVASHRKETALRKSLAPPLIGESKAMQQVFADIAEVADLEVNVLITGETGTGKSMLAAKIHAAGRRKDNSCFALNCSELAQGVLESELFGHEKGAFTDAVRQHKGIFELAHGGTLFLDEISEASSEMQAKLLRVLDEKSFTRVGGTKTVRSDFRLICATNRDLGARIAEGRFRRDLYFRLNVYVIEMPPLRLRRDDTPLLAEFYLKKFAKKYGRAIKGFTVGALSALRDYEWPGNVRELMNVIERSVIRCKAAMVSAGHLPFRGDDFETISNLNLKEMEKYFLKLALKRSNGNRTQAAALLGISRKTLIAKIKTYGLS